MTLTEVTMKRYAAFALVCAVVLSAPLAAQSPGRVTESVEVRVVEIPVTVVDKAGNPVRGLKVENFELIDQGERRKLAYFEEIDLTKNVPAGTPRNPVVRRNFALLFDLSGSTPANLERARAAALQFISSGMTESDLAAVAAVSVEQGFRFLTAFTTDRQLLRNAISSIGAPKVFVSNDPLLLSTEVSEMGAAAGRNRSEHDAMILESARDLNRNVQQQNDEFRRGRVDKQLQTLSMFARVLNRLRGQKQVIYLSEGFDAKLIQGREQVSNQDAQDEAAAIASGEIWKVDSDNRFGNASSTNTLKAMSDVFKRSDVVLHSVDIQGLRSNVDARSGAVNPSTESLFLLSNGTGGDVFKNTNDLGENFRTLMKQQEVVYVLGFSAPSGNDPNRFRNVKVKLVNAPSGARVRHRLGYYEGIGASQIEQTLSATEVMMNDIAQDDIEVQVLSAPFPITREKAQVPVVVEMTGSDLLDGVKGNTALGELFVYAFDENDVVKDFLFQTVALDVSKTQAALMNGGVKYYGTLALAPGKYKVRTLIRVAQSKRSGYRRVDVEVPDFANAVVLPPFIKEAPGKWLMVKGATRIVEPVEYPFHIAEESFVPAARAALTAGAPAEVALFTYNVPAEQLKLTARLKREGGETQPAKLAVVGRTPVGDFGSMKLLLRLDTTGLAPGKYTLEMNSGASNSSVPILIQ